jgi:hypothetical protein
MFVAAAVVGIATMTAFGLGQINNRPAAPQSINRTQPIVWL